MSPIMVANARPNRAVAANPRVKKTALQRVVTRPLPRLPIAPRRPLLKPLLTVIISCGVIAGCASVPKAKPASSKKCVAFCTTDIDCRKQLDDQLVAARKPLLSCVRLNADRGLFLDAHRCYRAMRLLESARWWLETIMMQAPAVPDVYPILADAFRTEFLCKLQRVAAAKNPEQIEQSYLDMVRAYP